MRDINTTWSLYSIHINDMLTWPPDWTMTAPTIIDSLHDTPPIAYPTETLIWCIQSVFHVR